MHHIVQRNVICFVALTLMTMTSASARFMTVADSAIVLENQEKNVEVKKDLSVIEDTKITMRIMNENGREYVAAYRDSYNVGHQKFEIVDAYTIEQNGNKIAVPKSDIEDKPQNSANLGFDDISQVLVGFKKPEIGSAVFLHSTLHSKTTVPGVLQYYAFFNQCSKNTEINFTSEVPLHIHVNDPDKILTVTEDQSNQLYKLQIKKTQSTCYGVINEYDANLDPSKMPYVIVTNLANIAQYGNAVSPLYYNIKNQPLPELMNKIAEDAKNIADESEQINYVTSVLATKVQYMGDWRTVRGMNIPHDLKEIAANQTGDCKDFSIATAAILETLGYKTYPVWILRGTYERDLPLGNLPFLITNHAILKAVSKSGKEFWLDPTNFVSMTYIYPDIAGKKAIVFDYDKTHIETTPEIKAEEGQNITKTSIEIFDDYIIRDAFVDLDHQLARPYTGLYLRASQKAIEDELLSYFFGKNVNEKDKLLVEMPDLSSRIVQPIRFHAKITDTESIINTNMGNGIKLLHTIVKLDEDDRVSDRHYGISNVHIQSLIIKNKLIKNIEALNRTFDNDYLRFELSSKYVNNDTEITLKMVHKEKIVPNKIVISDEYCNFKKQVIRYLNDLTIIL